MNEKGSEKMITLEVKCYGNVMALLCKDKSSVSEHRRINIKAPTLRCNIKRRVEIIRTYQASTSPRKTFSRGKNRK